MRNVVQDWCVEKIKKAEDRDEQLGPEDVFSPMPPSEGLKMLVSTMMTGDDDGNHVDCPFEVATWGRVESALPRFSSQVDVHVST